MKIRRSPRKTVIINIAIMVLLSGCVKEPQQSAPAATKSYDIASMLNQGKIAYSSNAVLTTLATPNYVPLPDNAYNKRFVTTIPEVYINNDPTVSIVVAQTGTYRLIFQPDGNLVLYNSTTPLWASGTDKNGGQFATTVFGGNGVIIIQSQANYWNVGTSTGLYYPYYPIWVLQDDGNFVGYKSYTQDAAGNVTITGDRFAATGTQGGQKSAKFGSLYSY